MRHGSIFCVTQVTDCGAAALKASAALHLPADGTRSKKPPRCLLARGFLRQGHAFTESHIKVCLWRPRCICLWDLDCRAKSDFPRSNQVICKSAETKKSPHPVILSTELIFQELFLTSHHSHILLRSFFLYKDVCHRYLDTHHTPLLRM